MPHEDVLKMFYDADVLLTPDAVEFLRTVEDPLEFSKLVLREVKKKKDIIAVDRSFLEIIAEERKESKVPIPVEVIRPPDFKPLAKEYPPELEISKEKDISGVSRSQGMVEDFVRYFRDRLERLKKLLEARSRSAGLVPIKALKDFTQGREAMIVGIISEKRTTRRGDLLLILEDEEGSAMVWVGKGRTPEERSCFQNASNLLLDEVVGIKGRMSNPFFIASEIVWPDVPIRPVKSCEKDLSIAFLSDTHVGSKLFKEKEFKRFLTWLNGGVGDRRERELAGRVKYIIIAGDLVDGIGIYPNQEKELVVKDIFAQYEMFSRLMESIPDYIEVMVIPGNHDAVRRAEPQPRLPSDLIQEMEKWRNFHFMGNPSWATIEGFRTLIYHGTSLDSIIAAISGCDYTYPEKSMVEVLKRRHLSPIYGGNSIVPEKKDYLVIDEVPDILHMGHVHKNGYEKYRGTIVINSGTWQGRTDFQIRQGHIPTPCVLPIFELKRSKISIVDFKSESLSPEG